MKSLNRNYLLKQLHARKAIVYLLQGVLDRFSQIQPKVIFSVNAVWYNGKVHKHLDKLQQVVSGKFKLCQ